MNVDAERADHLKRIRGLVFAVCKSFDLNRAERLNIAAFVLNREVDSFSSFTLSEWHRMADALQGAVYIAQLQLERAQTRKDAAKAAEALTITTTKGETQ